MKDQEISSYIESATLWADDMYNHFTQMDRWDWCEISDEGKRIYGLMFDVIVHDDSPVNDLISAVAAQASHGAIAAVAACLGVPADTLRHTVASWSENQDNPPPPVASIDAFAALIEENQKWLDDFKSGDGESATPPA